MITAEQARRIAIKKSITDTDIFNSISQRADNGYFSDNFNVVLSKEQIKNLEALGYIVSITKTHTFINW